jgi:FixJ family two-component response regulator
VRETLSDLLEGLGYQVKAFSSAVEFLASESVGQTGCLILDISMPVMTGPELQQELRMRQTAIPIIFISARADEKVFARLMERGAIACLLKPFGNEELRKAIELALEG